jgi:hypothetical protein
MKRTLVYNLRPFPKRTKWAEPSQDASSGKTIASRSKKASVNKSEKRRSKKPATPACPIPAPRVAFAPSPEQISSAVISDHAVVSDPTAQSASESVVATTDQARHFQPKETSPLLAPASHDTIGSDSKPQLYGVPEDAISKEALEESMKQWLENTVFISHELLERKLAMSDKSKLRRIMQLLKSKPFFQYGKREVISIDMTGFGSSRRIMYEKITKMLNMINKAAFTQNHFRPKPAPIVNEYVHSLWALDAYDENISTDLIRADPADHVQTPNFHWMDVEFFCECRKRPEDFDEALVALARYAHATYAHQIYRDHIYTLAVCGNEATFVLFDRAKVTHSEHINLETDCEKFVQAAVGLFSLDPSEFGYDTRFSWFPAPTGEPGDRIVQRELRLRYNDTDWQVLRVLYKHNDLLGRAPIIMRVGRVDDLDHRCVTKMVWRSVSLRPEAENLREFKGCEGIMQCLWSDSGEGRITTFQEMTLHPSPQWRRRMSRNSNLKDYSNGSSAVEMDESDIKPRLEEQEEQEQEEEARTERKEEKQKDLIQMPECPTLWHIGRFVDLLVVIRDAIVGSWAHVVCGYHNG